MFISNYAFSELNREIQDLYAHHLIANAQKGYITYNDISPQELRSYKIEEYPKLIGKEIQILEEIPNSHIYNKIIIW
ncbi:hypothetical protein LS68_002895 [Helicobacter sp. MIT 05-5293]|uniref:hypothetical protein n=1 Tax=Helicobacter sp. MIT 05-5293 TaxID=1548149 RepID=UPI00068FA460|nr:hypothetical protein [Helicobacter sp. MIT 05-5293]TLD81976.1 hypothetical protein LS68_002895 [Helicobacter sp. MIT 05-5293]